MSDDQTQPDHEHLFRVVIGPKMVVRFCERCGSAWLITELHDLLSNRSYYTWTQIMEEDEARKKITGD